uniref:Phage anti-repressor protein n=1 Tax=Desulfovibrio sp. U5L TaxID=596152 RepID=I2PWM3_9BACT
MAETRLQYGRGLHKPGPVLFQHHAVFDRAGQIPPDEAPFAHGVVYALGTADGRTKIGQSRNPAGRIVELERQARQHGAVVLNIFVSRACANFKEAEQALHEHFQADRLAGEWFSTAWPAVVERIKSMPLLSLLPLEIEDTLANGPAIQTINARDLHAFLEVGRDFSTWIKERIAEYGFLEGQDYVVFRRSPKPGSGNRGAGLDYFLTLDTAKELSMVERNDQGRRARRYFIECEKRLRQGRSLTAGQGEGRGLDLGALAGTVETMVKNALAEALGAERPHRPAGEPLPHLMAETEIAKQFQISVHTLRANRFKGTGFPYHRLGRSVRYDPEEVRTHLKTTKIVLAGGGAL